MVPETKDGFSQPVACLKRCSLQVCHVGEVRAVLLKESRMSAGERKSRATFYFGVNGLSHIPVPPRFRN